MEIDDFVGTPFDSEYASELGAATQGLSEAESAQEAIYQLLLNANGALETWAYTLPFYLRVQLPNITLDDAIFDLDVVKTKIEAAFDALRQADASIAEVRNAVREADAQIDTAADQWIKESRNYADDDQDAREMDRYVKDRYMV